jgi:hypothetical protein
LPCVPGDNVKASSTDSTVIGKYAGQDLSSGLDIVARSTDELGGAPYPFAQNSTGSSASSWYGNSLSDGNSNTTRIAAGSSGTAAQLCRNIGPDWFLPAKTQLDVLILNRAAIGGFNLTATQYQYGSGTSTVAGYWSSSQPNTYNYSAWGFFFYFGRVDTWNWNTATGVQSRVRCVRAL